MKTGRVRMMLGRLREAALANGGGLSDRQLLGRFVARRDEAAFAALVRRHGPMVLPVCRRVFRHAHDAEDAFQATFLVLAKKAAAVADREAVAGWLHGVAYRAALGARASALRRRGVKERQVEAMPHPVSPPQDDINANCWSCWTGSWPVCRRSTGCPSSCASWEGRSRKEAVRQLGLPEGTLSSRLATARKTLAARLSGGGAAVSAAALGTLFTEGAEGRVCARPIAVFHGVRRRRDGPCRRRGPYGGSHEVSIADETESHGLGPAPGRVPQRRDRRPDLPIGGRGRRRRPIIRRRRCDPRRIGTIWKRCGWKSRRCGWS